MWVEISMYLSIIASFGHPLREDVSWNCYAKLALMLTLPSSSSWGCELKWLVETQWNTEMSHPLREDVSWNFSIGWNGSDIPPVILFVRMWVEMIWMVSNIWSEQVILFVRMWVEMHLPVLWSGRDSCHPLREDVSWNVSRFISFMQQLPSSSSWGCELK